MGDTMEPLEDLLDETWDEEKGAEQGKMPETPKYDMDAGSLGSNSSIPKVHLSERLEVVYSRSLGVFESLNVEATASFEKHSDEESTLVSHDSSSEISIGSNTLDSATIATVLSGDAKMIRMEDNMMSILNQMQCAQIDAVHDKVVDIEHGLKDKMAIVEKSLRDKNRKMASLGCAANTDAILMDLASHEGTSSSEEDSATLNTAGSATLGTGSASSNSSGTSEDDSAEAEVEALVEELEVNEVPPLRKDPVGVPDASVPDEVDDEEDIVASSSPKRSKGSQWFKKLAARAPTPPLAKKKAGPDSNEKNKDAFDDSLPATPKRSGSARKTSSPPRLKTSPRDTITGKKRVPPKPSSPVKEAAPVVVETNNEAPASVPRLSKEDTDSLPTFQPKPDNVIKEMESIAASDELETIEELDDLEDEMESSLEPQLAKAMMETPVLAVDRSASLTSTPSVAANDLDGTKEQEPMPIPDPAEVSTVHMEDVKDIHCEPVVEARGLVPSPGYVNSDTTLSTNSAHAQVDSEADIETEIQAAIAASESALGALLATDGTALDDSPKNDISVASKESHDDGTILSSMEYTLVKFDMGKKEHDEAPVKSLLTVSEESDRDAAEKQMTSESNELLQGGMTEKSNGEHGEDQELSNSPGVYPTKIIINRKKEGRPEAPGRNCTDMKGRPRELGEIVVDDPQVVHDDEGPRSADEHVVVHDKPEKLCLEPNETSRVDDSVQVVGGIEFTLSDLEESAAAAAKVQAAPISAVVATDSPTSSAQSVEGYPEPESHTDKVEEIPVERSEDFVEEMDPIILISRIELADEERNEEGTETETPASSKAIPVISSSSVSVPEPEIVVSDDIEEQTGIEYSLSLIEGKLTDEAAATDYSPDPESYQEAQENESATSNEESTGEGFEYTLESIERALETEVTPETQMVVDHAFVGEDGVEYGLNSTRMLNEETLDDDRDHAILDDDSVAVQSTYTVESKNNSPTRKMSLWKKRSKKKGPKSFKSKSDGAFDEDMGSLEVAVAENQSRTVHESSGRRARPSSRKVGSKSPKRVSTLWKKRQKKETEYPEAKSEMHETEERPTSKKAVIELDARHVQPNNAPPETPGASADEEEKLAPESPASVIDIILGMSEMELLTAASAQDVSVLAGQDEQENGKNEPSLDQPRHDGSQQGGDDAPNETMETLPTPIKKSRSVLAKKPKSIVAPFMRRSRSSDKDVTTQIQCNDTPTLDQDSDVERQDNSGEQLPPSRNTGVVLQEQAVPESSMYDFMNSASSMMDVIVGHNSKDTEPTSPDSSMIAPVKISVLDHSKDDGLESKQTEEAEETPVASDVSAIDHVEGVPASGPAPWIAGLSLSGDDEEKEETHFEEDDAESERQEIPPKRKRPFWRRKSATKSKSQGLEDDANEMPDDPVDDETEAAQIATEGSAMDLIVDHSASSGPAPFIVQLSPSEDDEEEEESGLGQNEAEPKPQSPKRKRSFWKRTSITKSILVESDLEDDVDEMHTADDGEGTEDAIKATEDLAGDHVADSPAPDGPAPWIVQLPPSGDDHPESEMENNGEGKMDSEPKSPKRKRSFWKRKSTTQSIVAETKLDDDSVEEKSVDEKNAENQAKDDTSEDVSYTGTAPWELMATEAAEAAKAATSWAGSALGGPDNARDQTPAQQSKAPGADVEQYAETPTGGLRRRIRSLGKSVSSGSLVKLGSQDDDDLSLGENLKASRKSLVRSLGSNLSSTSSREMTRTTGSSSTHKRDNRGIGSRLFSSRRSKKDTSSEDDGMEPLLPDEEDTPEAAALKRRRATKIKLRRKKYTDLLDESDSKKEVEEDVQEEKRVVTPTACYDCSSCLANTTSPSA